MGAAGEAQGRDGLPGLGPVPPHDRRAERRVRHRPARPDRAARIAEALELVGLEGLGDRLPGTLSGGQQQRVALARALAPRPTVLLLDEPFSNLDTSLRVQVRAEVHALLLDLGITSVFVTHDQDEAFVLGDHVAVMSGGRIVQAAPPSELYARPVSPWVATFVGDANLVTGDATGDRADTSLGSIPLAESTRGRCRCSCDRRAIALEPGEGGVVELIEYYGHDSLYVVRTDDGASVRSRAAAAPELRRGDRVSCATPAPRPSPSPPPRRDPGLPVFAPDRGARPDRCKNPGVIVVAGAGAAGLAAAWYAARAGHEVTVVDRAETVGGMAASRTVAGLRVDHGSHRLHPAADPSVLADLRDLLGEDLQVRPRHGRIRLAGRWVGFPLRTSDLVRNLPPRFAAGAAVDALTSPLRRPRADTFAEVLRAGLGPTIADAFYAPYARKLWDTDPNELAGELARRRVSASSPLDLARRLVRGARPEGRTFLYPRRGFGQIVEAVADAAVAAGVTIRLGTGSPRSTSTATTASSSTSTTARRSRPAPSCRPSRSAPSPRAAGGPAVELRHRAVVLV